MKRFLLVPLLLVLIAGLAVGTAGAQGGGEGALTILMSSPGEGESFYVAPTGFLLSMPVAGRVVDYDTHLDPATVEVRLSVVSPDGVVTELEAPLDDAGFFEVWAAVQPHDRPFPSDDPHDLEDCAICHHWSRDLQIPDQATQLIVHATAEDGRTGHAVRRFRVDRSTIRDLTVDIDGLPEHASGGQVSAETLIYEWRRRGGHGPISEGQAALQVEGLAHADLTYAVSMAPFIVDGTRYTAEPTTVVIPGGSEESARITLQARPERASLAGHVRADVGGDGVAATVLAVDLFSGAAHTVTAGDDGAFLFADLPVAEYVLLARAPGGYHLPYHFDLTDALNAEADIHLSPAGSALLNGTVTLEGQPVPFAEVTVGGLPIAYGDPVTGAFALDAVPAEGDLEVEVTAAGCYGVRQSTPDRDLGEIALTLRPDTRVIEGGGARLYLPAESSATESDGVVTLTQGVLWVRPAGRSGGAPLQVRVGSALLAGDGAAFAVEKLTGARGRLYVSQGSVRVTAPDGDALEVTAGQTLVLEGVSGQPVPLESGVGPLLRSVAGSVARYVEAPTTAEKIADAAYQVVVSGARATLALAYGIALVFPIIVIGGLVLYFTRRRRTPAAR